MPGHDTSSFLQRDPDEPESSLGEFSAAERSPMKENRTAGAQLCGNSGETQTPGGRTAAGQ
jgi:hypothetical protein